jgi:hypothetical protein
MSNLNRNLKLDRLDELVLLFFAVIAVLMPPALFGVL